MKLRRLPLNPDEWTADERAEVLAIHRTFTEEPHGRRALEILKRDLWDNMSATAAGPQGETLLDDRAVLFNEGRRHAYQRIESYLDAYRLMTGQPKEA